MKTATPRPVAAAGRTRALSPFEMAVVLLYSPLFHRVAATIPYKKDDDTVQGHRNRDYPKAIVLLLGVLSRVCRSQPAAEALLRPIDQWSLIREHWDAACQAGVVPHADRTPLPAKPIRVGQWRYAQDLLTGDPDVLAQFEQGCVDASIDLALALGYFTDGSFTNPAKTSSVFADGTEVRSAYRSYVDVRLDPVSGEQRLAAIDPVTPGRVRAWLVDDNGRWRAVDPDTGEFMRKLPVDPEALASAKYGPTQSAYNVVPFGVRSDAANSRVTLWVGIDESENAEAATILRGIAHLDNTILSGRIQCLITDKIIRGVHQTVLYRKHGIIPITKVAVKGDLPDASEDDPTADGVVDVVVAASNKKGKQVKRLPLPPVSHHVPGGHHCPHHLMLVDGAVVEVDFSEDGTSLVEVSRPAKVQVKRAARAEGYSFSDGYEIACHHGSFTVWLCPHKPHGDDDGRKIAENYRIFPEGSDTFTRLYGSGRNSSEGGNTHHKNTYPHKRSQCSGRLAVHLDMYLYFLAENAKTWYFQQGFATIDPILHGRTETPLRLVS